MAAVLIIAVLLGVARILGVTHEAYQAFAHLFVGGLLGAWWLSGNSRFDDEVQFGRNCAYVAVGLSLLELTCFLYFKFAI